MSLPKKKPKLGGMYIKSDQPWYDNYRIDCDYKCFMIHYQYYEKRILKISILKKITGMPQMSTDKCLKYKRETYTSISL
jgi:hypothetical protein